jgi:hypothetical protein
VRKCCGYGDRLWVAARLFQDDRGRNPWGLYPDSYLAADHPKYLAPHRVIAMQPDVELTRQGLPRPWDRQTGRKSYSKPQRRQVLESAALGPGKPGNGSIGHPRRLAPFFLFPPDPGCLSGELGIADPRSRTSRHRHEKYAARVHPSYDGLEADAATGAQPEYSAKGLAQSRGKSGIDLG